GGTALAKVEDPSWTPEEPGSALAQEREGVPEREVPHHLPASAAQHDQEVDRRIGGRAERRNESLLSTYPHLFSLPPAACCPRMWDEGGGGGGGDGTADGRLDRTLGGGTLPPRPPDRHRCDRRLVRGVGWRVLPASDRAYSLASGARWAGKVDTLPAAGGPL